MKLQKHRTQYSEGKKKTPTVSGKEEEKEGAGEKRSGTGEAQRIS